MATPKRILITGTSSGLGLITAARLAAAGHTVIATMRDPAKQSPLTTELARRNAKATVMALDVADAKSVAEAIADIRRRFGGLDVLINNAGVQGQGFLEELSDGEFQRVFETNVFGVVRMTRAALPLLREGATPLVVNVSSLSGLTGYPGGTAYATSKWAIEGLSESLRYELMPFGIRVCLIEPGGYRTEIYQANAHHTRSATDSPYWQLDQALQESYRKVQRRDPEQFGETVERLIESTAPPFRTRSSVDVQLVYVLRRLLPFRIFSWLFLNLAFRPLAKLRVQRHSTAR